MNAKEIYRAMRHEWRKQRRLYYGAITLEQDKQYRRSWRAADVLLRYVHRNSAIPEYVWARVRNGVWRP